MLFRSSHRHISSSRSHPSPSYPRLPNPVSSNFIQRISSRLTSLHPNSSSSQLIPTHFIPARPSSSNRIKSKISPSNPTSNSSRGSNSNCIRFPPFPPFVSSIFDLFRVFSTPPSSSSFLTRAFLYPAPLPAPPILAHTIAPSHRRTLDS